MQNIILVYWSPIDQTPSDELRSSTLRAIGLTVPSPIVPMMKPRLLKYIQQIIGSATRFFFLRDCVRIPLNLNRLVYCFYSYFLWGGGEGTATCRLSSVPIVTWIKFESKAIVLDVKSENCGILFGEYYRILPSFSWTYLITLRIKISWMITWIKRSISTLGMQKNICCARTLVKDFRLLKWF